MTVKQVGLTMDGEVHATVRWAKTPELEYRLTMTPEGRLAKLEVHADEGSAVASTRLRMAPLGEMQAAVREECAESARMFGPGIDVRERRPDGSVERRKQTAAEKRAAEANRKAWTAAAERIDRSSADSRLAATAALFGDLVNQGSTTPYVELAEQLGISKKDAYNRMYQAREKGLFTSAGRGVVGGQLTDKAREILDGNR